MNIDRIHASMMTPEHFTNDALGLKHHSGYLSGFDLNKGL